jgi:hypothetical protein
LPPALTNLLSQTGDYKLVETDAVTFCQSRSLFVKTLWHPQDQPAAKFGILNGLRDRLVVRQSSLQPFSCDLLKGN